MIKKVKKKYVAAFLFALITFHYFGVFTHIFELDYNSEFIYPLDRNLLPLIDQLKHEMIPHVPPINIYNYTFLSSPEKKCEGDLRLVYIVKSTPENLRRRMAIRRSWGFESRFSDVPIRTVFIIGSTQDENLQSTVTKESRKFNDVIQASFIDHFFNSTIKTVLALKWAKQNCASSKFYMITNDNVYVSTKNVLYFVRNPVNYPDYIHDRYLAIQKLTREKRDVNHNRTKRQIEYELADDVVLYAGYVYSSSPHRHKSSKWYVSLEEYPYDTWPQYVIGDAFILSREALLTLYYGSLYTKHLKFDDLYLGIVARKTGIVPFHCEEIHFRKKQYSNYNYKYVVASTGYDDTGDLLRTWSEQKEMGNA